MNPQGFQIVETLTEIGQQHQATPAQTAIAWVLAQPGITSAIIGASRPEQLDGNLAAFDVDLDDELIEACEAAWWSLPRRPVIEGYR